MSGFGILLLAHYSCHMAGGNLKTHGDLKEKSLVSLGKQRMSFQLIFMNNDTKIPFGIRNL